MCMCHGHRVTNAVQLIFPNWRWGDNTVVLQNNELVFGSADRKAVQVITAANRYTTRYQPQVY